MKRFEVKYLPEAVKFSESIEIKAAKKLFINISRKKTQKTEQVRKKYLG